MAAEKTISFHRSTGILGMLIAGLIVTSCVLGGFLWSARSELNSQNDRTADERRAEQVATDYAVGASSINYQDVDPWLVKLKANTAPQLANKFDATAPKLQQLLVPLKWTSTSSAIDAAVASETNGIYKVNVFLNVTSTSAQTPDSTQTTVTYTVTVDKNSSWQITDVGGMEGALPSR
ncbi:hypothetical protein ACWIGI_10345 [Nocardia sp. NPDC055321]